MGTEYDDLSKMSLSRWDIPLPLNWLLLLFLVANGINPFDQELKHKKNMFITSRKQVLRAWCRTEMHVFDSPCILSSIPE